MLVYQRVNGNVFGSFSSLKCAEMSSKELSTLLAVPPPWHPRLD